MRLYRTLVLAALGLVFVVVVVGAYVRLSDAGLGCPDWPLCYGHPLPADIAGGDALAKAWKEMGHRYLAGTLGLLLLAIAVLSWKMRRCAGIATAIVATVVVQATLGKWTVTMFLKPAIVTAHLLGGMTTLALLVWLALSQFEFRANPAARALRGVSAAALAAVALQIALGGWVSANYAALACPDLPGCHGALFPPMDFANAFHVVRELGQASDGSLLSNDALTAIHWTHRMFALAVVGLVLFAAFRSSGTLRRVPVLVAGLVTLQFLLGISNVAFGLPLDLAAAHNAGAALLLASLAMLNFFAFRGLSPSR